MSDTGNHDERVADIISKLDSGRSAVFISATALDHGETDLELQSATALKAAFETVDQAYSELVLFRIDLGREPQPVKVGLDTGKKPLPASDEAVPSPDGNVVSMYIQQALATVELISQCIEADGTALEDYKTLNNALWAVTDQLERAQKALDGKVVCHGQA